MDAANFALSIQCRFHLIKWDSAVLKLPSCSKVLAADGRAVALRGPRIRIGIHRAAPGEWSTVEHEITRQTVFTGRAYAAAMAIADAANGGQILITWPVAEALLSHMHLIQFPQLSSMGTFCLKKAVDEVELFDLQPRESLEMPMRSFPLPRNVDFLSPGTGAAVIRPPESEAVTFVVVNISGSIMQGLIGRETNKRSSAPMKAHSLVDLAMRKLSTCATQVPWALRIPSFLQRCVAECRSCVLLPLAERRLHLDVQPRVPNVCDGTPQAISCAHCETKVWQGSRPRSLVRASGVRDSSGRSPLCGDRFVRLICFASFQPISAARFLFRCDLRGGCVLVRGCAGQVALLTCDYSAEQLSMCEPAERAADGRLPALARALHESERMRFWVHSPERGSIASNTSEELVCRWIFRGIRAAMGVHTCSSSEYVQMSSSFGAFESFLVRLPQQRNAYTLGSLIN